MNRLGMLVDLCHVSPDTMDDALRVVGGAGDLLALVGAGARPTYPRNVPDDVLQLLPKNGGVVMVTFVPGFISPTVVAARRRQAPSSDGCAPRCPTTRPASGPQWRRGTTANPEPRATLAQVADHIDHVRKVAGIDHVGIGSDFDGITERAGRPRGRLDLSGPHGRAAPARLLGRRRQEDPRAERAAGDPSGRARRRRAARQAWAVHGDAAEARRHQVELAAGMPSPALESNRLLDRREQRLGIDARADSAAPTSGGAGR